MERSKYILVFLLCCLSSSAQEKVEVYEAFTSDQMSKWRNVIEKMSENSNNSSTTKLELLNYYYGYIAWCIGQERTSEAKELQKRATRLLVGLQSSGYKDAELLAYESAFLGFQIAYSPLKAPFIGPKSVARLKEAVSLDSLSWFVKLQQANSLTYRPPMFGGSKIEALPLYLQALKLREQSGDSLSTDWNYLNILISIGQCYQALGKNDTASLYYRKILLIAPGFTYVQELLQSVGSQ